MNLRNYRTSIIIAITFTVLLSTFWYLQQLAFIVFLSLLLQLLLHPLVDKLSKRMPRGLAASLVIVVSAGLRAGFPQRNTEPHQIHQGLPCADGGAAAKHRPP